MQPAFSKKLKEGVYRAALVINANDGIEIPFNFDLSYKGKKPLISIKNADERIRVDEITVKGDSVIFKMPVFDTEFRTRRVGDNLEGVWINHYKTSNNVMRFKAVFGDDRRFLFVPGKANPVFEGRWETTFSPGSKDSSKAIGIFHHLEQSDYVTGTFLTETGDYRYLEGMKNGNKLYLSCFDGSHAYLFIAELDERQLLKGKFYSGATWVEDWSARPNDAFRLKDAESITFLKNKEEIMAFTFLNTEKKAVALSDKRYAGKPVIIQVMGSWCPNCMDESIYLAELYRKYKNEGLEIIALAFEKTTDTEKALAQVLRMKKRLGMDYEVLITGQTGKTKASEILSAVNAISAFPTTIFLNKAHQATKIHTGFSGPATGNEYELFRQSTEALVKKLLSE
jgi:thiol-disulfide isomerase/thioredoxin